MALSYGGSRRRGSSSAWRRWVATALVGALASTAPTGPVPAGAAAKPVGADSVSVSALRKGMTWTVLGQQGDYVHVGRDGQTDAYAGDTTVDQYLSALCLLVDARPAPAIPFDHDNGWARGAVKVTAPIRGDALTSRAQGDSICASTFGAGWRLAEFHDGRWGTDFVFSGGWSFWAAGVLTPGTRFWTAISDQPANPWNSVGDLPPPIVTPDDDLVLKTRLQENMQPLLRFAQVSEFHSLVNNAVARRFDGDDNVLLSSLISEAEATGIVNPTAADWVAFKNSVASFANINGTAYHPQIYIPNFQDGAVPGSSVTMVVFESDLARTALPAYDLDANGRLRLKSTLVDEAYTESNEVWVLSINERVDLGAEELAAIREMDESGATANTASGPIGTAVACNPTGLRNNKGMEYLKWFRVPNPSSVEHWVSGKLEPRLVIVGKGGLELKNAVFGKIKRRHARNGTTRDLYITTWDRAEFGDYWAYKWVEIDGGPKIEISLKLSAAIKIKIEVETSVEIKATFEKKYDDMGSGLVGFSESTHITYGTGVVEWTVCSVGGEGPPGDDNLARSATVGASSTYSGYSPARVNDGSRDTSLGGAHSWANNSGTYPPLTPEWVQLDFGTNRTVKRAVIYTTSGYPIRDFDVQVWNGFGWMVPSGGQIRNNTATSVTVNFDTTYSTRLVRILAHHGPTHQPGYVRVNEFEVYAS
ncbi:hypothetical protein GCM10027290_60280 [Micromonospora sonneratiae]|uniref:Discoidin domain-containing protein n=1 Tax=Micromonospora sonneratiae TaxID=1184706 RepID=A0ABW3YK33_9ACTN